VPSSELEHSPPRISGIGLAALASGCSAPLAAPCGEHAGATSVSGSPAPPAAPCNELGGTATAPLPPPLATRASLGAKELWASSLPAEEAPALLAEDVAGAITRTLDFFFFAGAWVTAAPFLFLDSASAVTFFAEVFFFFLSIEAVTSVGTSRSR